MRHVVGERVHLRPVEGGVHRRVGEIAHEVGARQRLVLARGAHVEDCFRVLHGALSRFALAFDEEVAEFLARHSAIVRVENLEVAVVVVVFVIVGVLIIIIVVRRR